VSIEIMFRLVCESEHCRRPFGEYPEGRTDLLMRRDMNDLRSKAQKKGWRRFRLSTNSAMGDYCPQCSVKIESARRDRLLAARAQ